MAAHRLQQACSLVAGSLRWPGTCLPFAKPVFGRKVHFAAGAGGPGGAGGAGGGGDGPGFGTVERQDVG